MSKGKLIVLEGLDGSGKATQAKLLAAHLKEQGFSVREITFPNYESDSSALVKMYLAGQFGQHPDDVNAYAPPAFTRWTAMPATKRTGAIFTRMAASSLPTATPPPTRCTSAPASAGAVGEFSRLAV